ncbi:MAG TPA: MarR family winged helix-turn-helix transcriptional regulator [Acidimicrobiales bacterium]|nr:MarR family winged helix-turn-helix transcriptional regulator [Acidimicrobiales bacterium]
MQEVPGLVDAVMLASRALIAVSARSLSAAPIPVTLPQYRVLVVLASRGPQRPSALADELGTAPSSMTRMCDRLGQKKLIERRTNEEDRREVETLIAPAGQAVVDSVTKRRRREIRRILSSIPTKQQELVVEALSAFGLAAGEVPEEKWPLGWPS